MSAVGMFITGVQPEPAYELHAPPRTRRGGPPCLLSGPPTHNTYTFMCSAMDVQDGEEPHSPAPSDFAAAASSVALGFEGTLR